MIFQPEPVLHSYRAGPQALQTQLEVRRVRAGAARASAVRADAYWHEAFSRESYYVNGRGYDQYRPAYALGWLAAQTWPGEEFAALEARLERQWDTEHGSSFLDWREVREAVMAGWRYARTEQVPPSAAQERALVELLRPLSRGCLKLADDLHALASAAQPDFGQQVIQRHIRMLRGFAFDLQKALLLEEYADEPLARLSSRLHWQWTQLKASLSSRESPQILELCELREQSLLAGYRRALRSPMLNLQVIELLQDQAHRLERNLERVSWVRQNWSSISL